MAEPIAKAITGAMNYWRRNATTAPLFLWRCQVRSSTRRIRRSGNWKPRSITSPAVRRPIQAAWLELRSSRAFPSAEQRSQWSGPRSRRRRGLGGDLFLQFSAGLADLRCHQRTVLNLKVDEPGLLSVAHCGFLHLRGHGERIAGHRLALFDAFDQLRAHRLDVFRRRFVFADNGFRRQLADLRGPLAMLDIVRHRQRRPTHPWRREIDRPRLVDPWPIPHLSLDLAFQIGHAQDSSYC